MRFDLTEQERTVYKLLATTDINLEEAAERLFLTRSTVATHLSNIYQKLGIHSRGALIRHYYSGGAKDLIHSYKKDLQRYIAAIEKLKKRLNEWEAPGDDF